jgi:hypothetical protein
MIKLDKIVFNNGKELSNAFDNYFEKVELRRSIHEPLFPKKINIKVKPSYLPKITFCNLEIFQIYGYIKENDSFALHLLIPSNLSVMDSIRQGIGNPDVAGSLTSDSKEINSTIFNWTIGNREVYISQRNFPMTGKKARYYLVTIATLPLEEISFYGPLPED